MEVIGEIPHDIDGIYVRNTENPVHEPIGFYHPFDGDSMLHTMTFKDGTARYRNRFVRTKAFNAEQEAGESLWAGILNTPDMSKRSGWGEQGYNKDASSTDVVVHAGGLLSTFWQCGEGYRLDANTMDQQGALSWAPIDGISAHCKVDERTGELLFFNYSQHAPYYHYGVADKYNRLIHYTAIPLPGPRMPHDMAFTEHYSIHNDFPLFWDPELLKHGQRQLKFFQDMPSRFAIIPRYGDASEVRWFEAEATHVWHWMNAYEEGDEIILEGYYQGNPDPLPLAGYPPEAGKFLANIDSHSFQSKLHRWHFNLKTGAVKEYDLDDRYLEFGTFNQTYAGRKTRYGYSSILKPGWFLFSGIVKHDLETGQTWQMLYGDQRYGGEAPFIPRKNATSEDDGYLVTFVTDMKEDRSECILIDAMDVESGPICRIILPHRICSGTHAAWGDGPTIRQYDSNIW
ncbi:lignostilbene-alpha,beta-dioxygenase-related enzyme [Gynuella sunshinyii YC6258]|nr:lignostilbene-alpha,beta-dioxygenase-related enzyme [Gynuella sunshinyii YC6258]